jgi:hypothetical protein
MITLNHGSSLISRKQHPAVCGYWSGPKRVPETEPQHQQKAHRFFCVDLTPSTQQSHGKWYALLSIYRCAPTSLPFLCRCAPAILLRRPSHRTCISHRLLLYFGITGCAKASPTLDGPEDMLPAEEIEYTLPLQLKDDQGPYEVHPTDPMFAVYLDRIKESVRGSLLDASYSSCCTLFTALFKIFVIIPRFLFMRRFLFCLSLVQPLCFEIPDGFRIPTITNNI